MDEAESVVPPTEPENPHLKEGHEPCRSPETVEDVSKPRLKLKTNVTYSKGLFSNSLCCTSTRYWWHAEFAWFEKLATKHHWKALCVSIFIGLFSLGLKLAEVDTDFDKLWIDRNDRVVSEWQYVANALRHTIAQSSYADQYGPDVRRSRLMMTLMNRHRSDIASDESDPSSGDSSFTSSKSDTFSTGMPGHEFIGTVEMILQSSSEPSNVKHQSASNTKRTGSSSAVKSSGQLLKPEALLDHMDLLVKIRRLQITVDSSKWSFKDLCQRATLPFGAEMHHIQAYLDMIIPCIIITPLDCFWEGAKVLGPEEAMWVPWFDERTLVQWTNMDPVGLLEDLRERYGNYSRVEITTLTKLFHAAGINHGYLNRSCLDPGDPACPISAPNYRGRPPNVSRILTGGCPGFAPAMLHWSEKLIVGGRVYEPYSSESASNKSAHTERSAPTLVSASSFQSLILLRSPRDLYDAVRHSDPYKHEGWTVADAQHVLDEWRRNLRRLVIEHNAGLQLDANWHFYALTDNSVRDLLRQLTLRLSPVKVIGCVLLVLLYGLVCLLDWRDPVRSQCWLAISGISLIVMAAISGLGICAAMGLSFNVLSIQVLPFLLMGLGVDGIFCLTTCYQCCLSRRITVATFPLALGSRCRWSSSSSISSYSSVFTTSTRSEASMPSPSLVLAEHGPNLLFGTVAIAGAFFSAAYIPVPLTRQFCLQAGILVATQSVSLLIVFPNLLKLDGLRRSQRRLDVLCCLQQPYSNDASVERFCPPVNRTPTALVCNYPNHRPFGERESANRSPGPHRCASLKCNKRSLSHNCSYATCTYPSIQVNVVNHMASGSGYMASGPQYHSQKSEGRAVSPGPSLHTKITVKSPTQRLFTEISGTDNRCAIELEADDRKHKGNPDIIELHSYRSPSPVDHDPSRSKDANFSNQRYNSQPSKPPSFYSSSSVDPLLTRSARRLAELLTSHWIVQVVICFASLASFICTGLLVYYRLRLGLDWSSLTPSDTIEHGFVKHSERDFGLHHFQVIARGTDLPGTRSVVNGNLPPAVSKLDSELMSLRTSTFDLRARVHNNFATTGQGIDFPMQQRQLHHLYTRILQLPGVMLSGQRYWLQSMRDWLLSVQSAFDSDRRKGLISANGHWGSNASELGVLGLRLVVQTDRGPELSRIATGRLVRNGIIDPPAFYALLRVWRSYDTLNYTSLACVLYPEPGLIQLGRLSRSGRPADLHPLPPAEPIEFVQTNFYVVGVRDMHSHLDLIRNVRTLTEAATARGAPTFPISTSFTFLEQFLFLTVETATALGIFFGVILVAALLIFASPVVVILLILFGAGVGLCSSICGIILLGLELNPISACLTIFSAGFGAKTAVGFLGSWPISHYACDSRVKNCSCKHLPPKPYLIDEVGGALSNRSSIPDYCSSHRRPTTVRRNNIACSLGQTNHSQIGGLLRSRHQPDSVAANCGKLSEDCARHRLTQAFCNNWGTLLHSTVGFILALVVLAAARVQLISDYFFCLLAWVSFACFLNVTCLIPTLCYIILSIQLRFTPSIFPKHPAGYFAKRRASTNNRHSTSPDCRPVDSDASLKRYRETVFQKPTPFDTSNVTSSNISSVSVSEVPASPTRLEPTPLESSLVSKSRNFPIFENTSASLRNITQFTFPSSKSSRLLTDITNSELYKLCNQKLHRLPLESRQTPEAAAAAAAVVAAVAAAATSVRSRPASLSTISEEPSPSSSTINLNHASSPSNVLLADSFNTNHNQVNNRKSSVEDDLNALGNPPVDILQLMKIFNLDRTTAFIYRQLYEIEHRTSLPIQDGSCGHPFVSRDIACHLSSPNLPVTQGALSLSHNMTDRIPPPSYSSVISQESLPVGNPNFRLLDSCACLSAVEPTAAIPDNITHPVTHCGHNPYPTAGSKGGKLRSLALHVSKSEPSGSLNQHPAECQRTQPHTKNDPSDVPDSSLQQPQK